MYVLNLNQTSASGSITANGGTPKAITTETGWIECNPPASGTLTSLVLNRTASAISNNALRFSAIKVDGKILVDHNNIGVDASGQDNHFHDENFLIDGNNSQVWSKNLSSPHIDGVTHPERAFDGIISDANYAYNPTFGESLVWTTNGISDGSHTYKVYYDSATALSLAYTVGGVETVVGNSAISDSFTATNVQSIKVTGDVSISGPLISAIEVDGEILVDPGVGIDTVLDTPMRNYAVLESGTNGNLVASAAGTNVTYTGEPGRDYYYEANAVGVIHSGGDAISSTDGVTYNFGQQPFAASNVTHDWDAGTVMLDVTPSSDPTIDDSQVWSEGGSQSNPDTNRPLTYLFDGTTSTVVAAPNTGIETNLITLAVDISVTSKLELWTGTAGFKSGPYVLLKDGVEQGRYTPVGETPSGWYEVPNMAGKTFNQIQVTRADGNYPGAYTGSGLGAIKRDGKWLIDPPSPGPYDTLYETWDQWARTALGYALDRIAKLEQQRTSDLATIEDLRTNITAALSRITSIESNEVADDAVDTVLLSTVADLISRVEALEGA